MTASPGGSDGGATDGAAPEGTSGDRKAAWAWRLALLAPLVVPWVVIRTTSATLLFPWGMIALKGSHVTTLPDYLSTTAGLPRYLRMWPVGAACYALGAVWAAGERVGADPRVTAGLFALAALAAGWTAWGLGVEPTRSAIPVGTLVLGGLSGWAYLRSLQTDPTVNGDSAR